MAEPKSARLSNDFKEHLEKMAKTPSSKFKSLAAVSKCGSRLRGTDQLRKAEAAGLGSAPAGKRDASARELPIEALIRSDWRDTKFRRLERTKGCSVGVRVAR
jgi:hypothetical protein